MYLLNINVNIDKFFIQTDYDDYTGRVILYLRENGFDLNYLLCEKISPISLARKIISLKTGALIIHVTIDNKELIQRCLLILEKKGCLSTFILIGKYIENHFFEYTSMFNKLHLFGFQYLQEYNIKEFLLKNLPNNVKGIIFKDNNNCITNNSKRCINIYSKTISKSPYLEEIIPIETIFNEGFYFSHGCINNCKFCPASFFTPQILYKPLSIIKQELLLVKDFLQDKKDFFHIEIMDENIFADENKAYEIIQLIKKIKLDKIHFSMQTRIENINKDLINKLIEINVKEISIGIESIRYSKFKYLKNSNISKKEYMKKLFNIIKYSYSKDICIGTNFIFGLPEEKKIDIYLVLIFALLTKHCDINVNYFNLIPSTFFGNKVQKLRNKESFEYHNFFRIIKNKKYLYFRQNFFYLAHLCLFMKYLGVRKLGNLNLYEGNEIFLNFVNTTSPKDIIFDGKCFQIPYIEKRSYCKIFNSFNSCISKYRIKKKKLRRINIVDCNFTIFYKNNNKYFKNILFINLTKAKYGIYNEQNNKSLCNLNNVLLKKRKLKIVLIKKGDFYEE